MHQASIAKLADEPFEEKLKLLAADIRRFMYGDDPNFKICITAQVGWNKTGEELSRDPTDVGAKPIAKDDWQDAFKVAMKVAWAAPWMPRPTPGADPEGFVWFTYELGDTRRLALQVHMKGDRPCLHWTVQGPLSKFDLEAPFSRTIAETINSAVREVAESARSVFGVGLA
ncbi:MAG TPA: hypothetical protein VGI39_39100 [Polyangiaceae bacterium]|jgi:hypothetical protein